MECINQPTNNPNVLYKQIPIAAGFYLIAPSGNKHSKAGSAYYSYFETDCVEWFEDEMFTFDKIGSGYSKTNLEIQITPQEEESFQLAEECWLCEEPFTEGKARDHDQVTGKYRRAAHSN